MNTRWNAQLRRWNVHLEGDKPGKLREFKAGNLRKAQKGEH